MFWLPAVCHDGRCLLRGWALLRSTRISLLILIHATCREETDGLGDGPPMHRSLAGARPTDPALEGPVGGGLAPSARAACMLHARRRRAAAMNITYEYSNVYGTRKRYTIPF